MVGSATVRSADTLTSIASTSSWGCGPSARSEPPCHLSPRDALGWFEVVSLVFSVSCCSRFSWCSRRVLRAPDSRVPFPPLLLSAKGRFPGPRDPLFASGGLGTRHAGLIACGLRTVEGGALCRRVLLGRCFVGAALHGRQGDPMRGAGHRVHVFLQSPEPPLRGWAGARAASRSLRWWFLFGRHRR
jgi:hypothetical protein